MWKIFRIYEVFVIHALIIVEYYNSIRFLRKEVADFGEIFASVNDGGCFIVV